MNKYFILFFSVLCLQLHAQTWNTVAYNDFDGGVNCFEVYLDKLIITAGYNSDRMVTWNEVKIDTIPFGATAIPKSLKVFNNQLVAGGTFDIEDVDYTQSIAKWNDTIWSALMSSWMSGTVYALEVYNGELYAGGIFNEIDGVNVHHIAKWDGNQWSDVGGGINLGATRIETMVVYNGELYVGGRFISAGGVTCNNIARWNGNEWNDVDGGVNENVYSMVVDTNHNILYAGGGFTMAGSTPARCVAQWDGSNWSNLGNGILFTYEIGLFQDTLYAAIPPVNNLVTDTILEKWNGTDWIPIFGFNKNIHAIQEYKGNLYLGGGFTKIPGNIDAKYIACYGNSCPEPLGVKELTTLKKSFIVYPNPNTGIFTIKTDEVLKDDVEIVITDITGKMVLSAIMKKQQQSKEINLPAGAKGIYTCSIFKQKQLLQTERIVLK